VEAVPGRSGLTIRRLAEGDDGAVRAASHLFDGPARDDATARFLADPNHHLLVAYVGAEPVGFVSGVEVTHPDKGTEMFLYELSVEEPLRRRGIGRALLAALGELAQERGCYGMFVLTARDNDAALATYGTPGAVREDGWVMFTWEPPGSAR
jgi:[ribosomal protein S18]-alanine N-acetyltransferase